MHPTQRRIIDITYQEQLSHLSSTLSAWPIIHEIYEHKRPHEPFILSNGHAGLALYCELEARTNVDAVMLLHKHGIHPHRDVMNGIWASTGSLGCGLTLAVGHAMADRSRQVYCLISDGECAEGSIWEALRFADDAKLTNLQVYANINGQCAYDSINSDKLAARLRVFMPTINVRISQPPKWNFASGLLSHYYVLKSEDYQQICASG